VTLQAGGSVLFGPEVARQRAGDFVLLVAWFNFLAGFAYLVGAALFLRVRWGRWLALEIAAAALAVAAAFAVHVPQGGAYEGGTAPALAAPAVFGLAMAGIARASVRPDGQ
jgi:peptidoglycan/LPS O-acetylase OafA/YrhL